MPGVNFTNNLLQNFLYKSASRSFSLVMSWQNSTFVQNACLNVNEIDSNSEMTFYSKKNGRATQKLTAYNAWPFLAS